MNQPQKQRMIKPILTLSVSLVALAAQSLHANDWPQWRGPDRTDVSKETGLLKQWPANGPKQVWLNKDGGLGYAGFSVANGKLFTMGARADKESLLALDASTGKELWAAENGLVLDNKWGDGPRGTPTVDGDRVYALSGRGDLVCAQVNDGKVLWKHAMSEFGGSTPNWGYAESPLVDGKQVVCTPGGSKGALVALDKLNGQTIWQAKEFTDGAQYSSIIAVDHNGGRQYVQLTMQHFVGISAKDGKLLWKSDWPGKVAVIPTPIFRDGHVYIASGYKVGCKLVKVGPGNQVSDVYMNNVMENHHGGVILVGDHLYGHSDNGGWTCQNFKTGEAVWTERAKFTKGAVACADGMLYCLEEKSGAVVLIDTSPKGWQEHGRFTLSPQTTQRKPQGRIWTHPVIANGKLYLRDQELIFCFDIKR